MFWDGKYVGEGNKKERMKFSLTMFGKKERGNAKKKKSLI